ncbi:MAG: hypothetical protein OXE83_15580 [Gammaproteobacteria bacterium]|nr:hypothetical protein [Gammaproteobacteria bacterium]
MPPALLTRQNPNPHQERRTVAADKTLTSWVEDFADKGFRQTIRDRDRPWGDCGEKPKEDEA